MSPELGIEPAFWQRLPIMPRHPVSDLLLHNFPENGVKFLLNNPGNLRDVMAYLAARYRDLPDLGCFDFSRRTIEPDTLIRSDFSHGVTDLLVRLPFRSGREPAAWIKMYLPNPSGEVILRLTSRNDHGILVV